MNYSEMRKFLQSLFFKSSELGFRSKKVFFCSFWLTFYPLDPDLESQNLADPTDPDPDPKHCFQSSPLLCDIQISPLIFLFSYFLLAYLCFFFRHDFIIFQICFCLGPIIYNNPYRPDRSWLMNCFEVSNSFFLICYHSPKYISISIYQ